jgi:hypothetical protein
MAAHKPNPFLTEEQLRYLAAEIALDVREEVFEGDSWRGHEVATRVILATLTKLLGTRPGVKRYLLFTGLQYYPGPGWTDFRGSYADLEKAVADAPNQQCRDWYQVVDAHTGKIVAGEEVESEEDFNDN